MGKPLNSLKGESQIPKQLSLFHRLKLQKGLALLRLLFQGS